MAVDYAALLCRLADASGVSGHEDEVAELVRELMASRVDQVRSDALGNVIGLKRGRLGAAAAGSGAPAILLAAHMDEIGLVVTAIEEGFLRLAAIGGWDQRQLLAQPVVVHGRAPLRGVIGARPPHVLSADEQRRSQPLEELFVDVGLSAEEVGQVARVGDVVSLDRQAAPLAGGRWTGKAMDNRASIAALLVTLDELAGLAHDWDVLAVATVQEEVGLKGAATAAFGLEPEAAVVLDVGFAKQPGAGDLPFQLDGGPLVAFGPNIHPVLFESLTAAAERLEMATQLEPLPGPTGTDAGAIQVAAAGIPTALVGVPSRYMHSTVETVALKDVVRAGRLVAHTVAGLDADFPGRLLADAGDWDAAEG
jgi:endoglucanase